MFSELDELSNEAKRKQALRERCAEYHQSLLEVDPEVLARNAALAIGRNREGFLYLSGELMLENYLIYPPTFAITKSKGEPATLREELLWLHYLERADGTPLSGRWVNLSEIGGLFYQQAFQGYCGDELAEAWGDDLEGLKKSCFAAGGWPIQGLADLAFEWRVLPRLPLCLCYRLPGGKESAWATMLFDASADHYVAADVAAIVGKNLTDKLKPQ